MVLDYRLPTDVPHFCALLPGATPHPTTEVVEQEALEAQKKDHRPKASLFDLQAARRFVSGHLGSQQNRQGQPFILSAPPAVHRDAQMPLPPPLPEANYTKSYGHSFAAGELARQAAFMNSGGALRVQGPQFFTPYQGPYSTVGPYTASLPHAPPPLPADPNRKRFSHQVPYPPHNNNNHNNAFPPPPMQRIVIPPPPPRPYDDRDPKKPRR